MNIDFLRERRKAVIDRHVLLESVPGSGWHRDDSPARDTRDRGFAPLAQRPVAIQYDSTVYVVGECVGAVRVALAEFVKVCDAEEVERREFAEKTGTETESIPAQKKHALTVARRVVAGDSDVIELDTKDWNGVSFGLGEVKVLVVLTGLADSKA